MAYATVAEFRAMFSQVPASAAIDGVKNAIQPLMDAFNALKNFLAGLNLPNPLAGITLPGGGAAYGVTTFQRAFDCRDALVLVCDTNYDAAGQYGWVTQGNMPQVELDWIAAQLAVTTQAYAILIMHHPPSDISQWTAYPEHEPVQAYQDALGAVLAASPIPCVVFCGHDHVVSVLTHNSAVPIGAETQAVGKWGNVPVISLPTFSSGYKWQMIEVGLFGGVIDVFVTPRTAR